MLVSMIDGGVKVVSYILQCHYGALTCMLLLFIFMKTNKIFEPRIRHSFYGVISTIVTLCIVDSICIYYLSFDRPCTNQLFFIALGYTLRPLTALFAYYIVRRHSFRYHVILWLPVIINAVIVFSSLCSPLAFSYSPNNHYIRGPLGFTPHVISIFYMCLMFWATIELYRERDFSELLLLVALGLFIMTAVVLDMFFRSWLTVTTLAVALSFYYLYFHSQAQMRDSLTNAYNRKKFYMDSAKFHKDICGLVGFDLNDLKLLNDRQGHAAGDKGLITMTEIIRSYLPRRCKLYRTGGDEFVVLCRKISQETADEFIVNVKNAMDVTPYRCAAGLAYSDNHGDIDELYKLADSQMYQDKTRMKAGRNYRESSREQ